MNQKLILKTNAARKAVEFIQPGMCVGLGSGSTSEIALKMIGDLDMELTGIASSEKVADLARSYGIKLVHHSKVNQLDINIDGADEVDQNYNMIKGGGGALLREKINIMNAVRSIIIVDESKLVRTLGRFPLPVEVNPFGWESAQRRIEREFEVEVEPRLTEQMFITDNGNYILDIHFGQIEDPDELDQALKEIPGVLETGLFMDCIDTLVVGSTSQTKLITVNR